MKSERDSLNKRIEEIQAELNHSEKDVMNLNHEKQQLTNQTAKKDSRIQ